MIDKLYGRNAVLESLRARRRKHRQLLISSNVHPSEGLKDIVTLAEELGVPIAYVDRFVLDKQVRGSNHQGVILETSEYPYSDIDNCLAIAEQRHEQALLLLFDHIQDPQNIGTLIRTAEVVGIHGIILPGRRAATITPAVVNASSGATEHLSIALVSNLNQTIRELQRHTIWVVGLEDDSRSSEYDTVDLDGPLAIVIGAEGSGLARLTRERCDCMVRLPMHGKIASLNAAVAGSIFLYHIWRQRERKALPV
jgi:23S rRNA (guanosine2251-2'-O)-methyltransferase